MSDVPEHPSPGSHREPDDWTAAAAEFVQARIELIRLEAKDAGREAGRKVGTVIVVVSCAILVWLLILAGLIGWISASRPDWPWYHVTLVAAGLHLAVALLGLLSLKKGGKPSFPITRSELAKDQAWLESLKKKR